MWLLIFTFSRLYRYQFVALAQPQTCYASQYLCRPPHLKVHIILILSRSCHLLTFALMYSSKEPMTVFYFFSLLNCRKLPWKLLACILDRICVRVTSDGKITSFFFFLLKELRDFVCLFSIDNTILFLDCRELRWSGAEGWVPGVDLFKCNADMSMYSYRFPDVFSEQITYRTESFVLCLSVRWSSFTERAIFVLI